MVSDTLPGLENSHGVGCRVRVLTPCSTRFRRTLARKQSLNRDMISVHFNVGDNILADTSPERQSLLSALERGVLEAKTPLCVHQRGFRHRLCADVSPMFSTLTRILLQSSTNG